ncbi:MAG TPA: GNAT family N-acetyltransferase [Acidimicrobiales bacterium]|nr:GNAT family N-acetyltransferase [Acidimicrobiales bacterium]
MTHVRPFQPSDIDDVYDVCVRTGDVGQDASSTFERPRLIPDIFAGPYVEREPELAFVIDDGGRAVGYVLGTADTVAFVQWYRDVWLPQVSPAYPPTPEPPFQTRDQGFLHLLRWPERMLMGGLLEPYPAHLHIDILPPWQGRGLGRGLMEEFLRAANRAGAPGVHLGVDPANTRAFGFYKALGFERLGADNDEGVVVFARSTASGAAGN